MFAINVHREAQFAVCVCCTSTAELHDCANKYQQAGDSGAPGVYRIPLSLDVISDGNVAFFSVLNIVGVICTKSVPNKVRWTYNNILC